MIWIFRSPATDKGSKVKVKKVGSKPSKEKAVLGNQPHISEKGQGEKWVPWLFVCRPLWAHSRSLQAPVYHILPPTTAIIGYAFILQKMASGLNTQKSSRFLTTRTRNIAGHVSVIAACNAKYTSETKIV